MTKKEGVAEKLAANPTMPLAVVLGGAALGTALLSRSAHEGARELWNGLKSKLPDAPAIGGGSSSTPPQLPQLPPFTSSSPSPTIVNITNPAPLVQTTPAVTTPVYTAPPLPKPATPSLPERLRDQGFSFIRGVPIPTDEQGIFQLGRLAARTGREILEGIPEAGVQLGGGAFSFFGGLFSDSPRVPRAASRAERAVRNVLYADRDDFRRFGQNLYSSSSRFFGAGASPRPTSIPVRTGSTPTATRSSGNSGGSGGSFGGASSYSGGSPGSRRPIGTFVPIRRA